MVEIYIHFLADQKKCISIVLRGAQVNQFSRGIERMDLRTLSWSNTKPHEIMLQSLICLWYNKKNHNFLLNPTSITFHTQQKVPSESDTQYRIISYFIVRTFEQSCWNCHRWFEGIMLPGNSHSEWLYWVGTKRTLSWWWNAMRACSSMLLFCVVKLH